MSVNDLRVTFGTAEKTAAVNGVTMHFLKGGFNAIVGESGAGKSVTALSITRLVREAQVSGEVLFEVDGETRNLLVAGESELLQIRGRRISYVFQDPASSLNPLHRVGRQVAEAFEAHFPQRKSSARAVARDRLKEVGLTEEIESRYPHQLSGGMKQRVMIAMALSTDPDVLLADEPTTALDAVTEYDIAALIDSIRKKRNLTVVWITHQIALAAAQADRMIVMREGCVVECLDKKDGRFYPADSYTRLLFELSVQNREPKSLFPAEKT